MKFLLGKKLEMTQIFTESGLVLPVTKVQAGQCTAVQVKSREKDGYSAVQFAYGERKKKNVAKPQQGHFLKSEVRSKKSETYPRYVREMRLKDGDADISIHSGDVVDVSSFVVGDMVSVTGTSKGKGFQGVVKRYGFSGGRKTHGNKDQLRMPGSVGAKGPAHVFKGTRMGGRMGNEQVTTKNMEVVKVDEQENVLYLRGAVPGARNGLIVIKGEGEMKVRSEKKEAEEEIKKEAEAIEVKDEQPVERKAE
ncbi:50S ribosomal protein L3 [Candidatus Falkowbacteria bacterium RIFOXYA2_FULL_47_9]|uniref:Large ribosomal subunit protein uL3 n=1 Tax=Candidatus Falkowbacteria bacterium RIFOXYA2_FULL_47_9 TaxID=1797995 RepID=A0A1F5SIK2_9BACT|nr:MAG: 50S ribosomal protein L3 [Candidatus Falkowbacteria bacterium RIFOXYA2_FULL_47_9]